MPLPLLTLVHSWLQFHSLLLPSDPHLFGRWRRGHDRRGPPGQTRSTQRPSTHAHSLQRKLSQNNHVSINAYVTSGTCAVGGSIVPEALHLHGEHLPLTHSQATTASKGQLGRLLWTQEMAGELTGGHTVGAFHHCTGSHYSSA